VAKDLNCDLVAMVPGTHTKVATYLIGSTCERVVKHTHSSVLIIRSANAIPLKNVVIGIDGSDSANEAMLKAAELFSFAKRDLNITLVNVVSVTNVFKFISPARFVAAVEDNLMMSGEACLAGAEKLLSDAGVKKIEVKLRSGDAATEVIKVATEVDAQLIVVGAQGRSAIEHFLLGSTSSKVATHAPCTTFVFKKSEP
jgi:nucleotide-binding universal stress UspA family protein